MVTSLEQGHASLEQGDAPLEQGHASLEQGDAWLAEVLASLDEEHAFRADGTICIALRDTFPLKGIAPRVEVDASLAEVDASSVLDSTSSARLRCSLVDKKALSERDICTKFITPAIAKAGWDVQAQVRENVALTKGRVIVRGRLVSRGKAKFADYVLCSRAGAHIPLAIVEAKNNSHAVGDGMQQGLGYADMLDVPFVFSSNGDGFLLHDKRARAGKVKQEVALDEFPSPEELWNRYCARKILTPATEAIVTQSYYSDGSGKTPSVQPGGPGVADHPDPLVLHR